MDGRYPPPVLPLGAYYSGGYHQVMVPPDALQPRLQHMQTLSMDSLANYPEYEDSSRIMMPQQGTQRARRRHPPGSEHVKHRRTRSGCYTCRQRRIKCDERHPTCARCQKGKRECSWPGTSSLPARTSRSDGTNKSSTGASTPSESGEEDEVPVPISPDIEEEVDEDGSDDHTSPTSPVFQTSGSSLSVCKPGDTPSPIEPSPTNKRPFARPQPVRSASKQSVTFDIRRHGRWSSLPKDVAYYLQYHQDKLSHHHYAFKYDGGDFLKTTFLEIALNDSSASLLYAIVAFSAYHHAVSRNDENISGFLSYYNKSIAYLQQALKSRRHNVAILLTILQLATVEEFLGDWVNLLGHQKAAFQIITDLFTPQTIMQDETRRKIINWYIRFDLFAGIMSGAETALGREWFAAAADFYRRQIKDRPQDLGAQFEEYFATSRLIATDVTLLFASKTRDTVSDTEFLAEMEKLSMTLDDHNQRIEGAFRDISQFARSLPRAPITSEDDTLGTCDPNILYTGDLSTMNLVMMDQWAIHLMFKYQRTLALGQVSSPDLTRLAMRKAKLFEAIQNGDEGNPAAVLGCQASLGVLALFLPKDSQHTMWCRRKFADIENLGYIYPATYRKRMVDLWGEDVAHWWLPDNKSYSDTIRTIREFVEYRATRPNDAYSTGIRDMSGIFRSLNIRDQGLSDDLSSTGGSASPMSHDRSPQNRVT